MSEFSRPNRWSRASARAPAPELSIGLAADGEDPWVRPKMSCQVVLLVGLACVVACHRPAPDAAESISGESSSGSTSSAEVTTTGSTTGIICADTPETTAPDWCASNVDQELCYGHLWQLDIPKPVNKVLIGDIDGSGTADILVFDHTPQQVRQFLGDGCTPVEVPAIPLDVYEDPLTHMRSAVMADFDGDGRQDLLATFSGSSSSLVLFAGSEAGLEFRQKVEFGSGERDLGVGDVNGDGMLDVVYPQLAAPMRIAVHFGEAGGTLGPPQSLQELPYQGAPPDAGIQIMYFDVLDFNEDGRADLNVGIYEQDLAGPVGYDGQIMFGSGDGTFDDRLVYDIFDISVGRNVTGSGDFDGDGHVDLLVPGFVYLGDGGGGFKSAAPFPFAEGYELPPVIGDLDGDGRDDAMLHDRWHLGTAEGLGTALEVPTREIRLMGDVNGDGTQDIVELVREMYAPLGPLVVSFGGGSAG